MENLKDKVSNFLGYGKKLGLMTLAGLSIYSCSSPRNYLSQCLEESNVKMYGVDWGFSKDQKLDIGEPFEYVDYTDCDLNRDKCDSLGFRSYPVWIIDGEIYEGHKDLEVLSDLTGCDFLKENLEK